LKTTFVSFLIVAVLAPLLLAEESTDDRAAQAQQRLEELKTRLNLTPEQTAKLEPLIRSEMGELKTIRDQYGADASRREKKKMLKAMQGVQKKYQPQIAAVLTPDQQAEWKKIKEERKKELKQMAEERKANTETQKKKKGY
jgi:hypothetical protein